MRDNGRRTLVRCEITRKRTLGKGGGGGGADKQGGAHSRYQFFQCGKIGGGGGGRMNDGGRSDGTLWYITCEVQRTRLSNYFADRGTRSYEKLHNHCHYFPFMIIPTLFTYMNSRTTSKQSKVSKKPLLSKQ